MEQRFILYALGFGALVLTLRIARLGLAHSPSRLVHCTLATAACGAALFFVPHFAITTAVALLSAALLIAPPLAVKWAALASPLAGAADAVVAMFWWGADGRAMLAASRAHRAVARGDLDAATAALASVPTISPLTGSGQHVAATALFVALNRGQWTDVVRNAGALPLTPAVGVIRARAYAELGRPVEALDVLRRALFHPSAARYGEALLMAELATYATLGDTTAVEAALHRQFPSPRPLARGWRDYWRGRALLARQDHDHATACLRLARAELAAYPLAIARIDRILAGQETLVAAEPSTISDMVQRRYVEALEVVKPWFRFVGDLSAPWITLAITGGCLAVMLAASGSESQLDWLARTFGSNGPRVFESGEVYRVFTANFVHANTTHVSFNALALLLFGAPVERAWGRWVMLATFLLAGTGGHLMSMLWEWNSRRISVGASTGVYGILALYALTFVRYRIPGLEHFLKMRLLALATLIGADFALTSLEPRVDTAGHLGGLLIGLALGGTLIALERSGKRASSTLSLE